MSTTIEGEAPTVAKRTQGIVRALEAKREDLTRALGSRVDPDLFIQIVANAYLHDPGLMRCSQMSIYVAAMDAARTGLRPDGEESVIIAYRDRESGETLAQFQPMYQGLIRLMLRAGARKVWSHVVYSGDFFEYELGLDPTLRHRPVMGDARGEIVAAYAVVKLANGETQFEVMDREELERVRKASKVPNSPAYRSWLSEMYRKAPLRRLRKWVEMDPVASAAFRLDAALDAGSRGEVMGKFAPEHESRTISERAEAAVSTRQNDLAERLKGLSAPTAPEDEDPIIREAREKVEAAATALDERERAEVTRVARELAAIDDLDELIALEKKLRG